MFKNKLKFLKFTQKNDDNQTQNAEKETANDKKKIENLVVFVIILVITIIAINLIWNGDEKNEEKKETNTYSKQLASNRRRRKCKYTK